MWEHKKLVGLLNSLTPPLRMTIYIYIYKKASRRIIIICFFRGLSALRSQMKRFCEIAHMMLSNHGELEEREREI